MKRPFWHCGAREKVLGRRGAKVVQRATDQGQRHHTTKILKACGVQGQKLEGLEPGKGDQTERGSCHCGVDTMEERDYGKSKPRCGFREEVEARPKLVATKRRYSRRALEYLLNLERQRVSVETVTFNKRERGTLHSSS